MPHPSLEGGHILNMLTQAMHSYQVYTTIMVACSIAKTLSHTFCGEILPNFYFMSRPWPVFIHVMKALKATTIMFGSECIRIDLRAFEVQNFSWRNMHAPRFGEFQAIIVNNMLISSHQPSYPKTFVFTPRIEHSLSTHASRGYSNEDYNY